VKNRVSKFNEFEKIYEQEQQNAEAGGEAPLRGYPADQVIARIEELMNIMPDRVKFGVPADIKGYSTSYRDANGAIEKINDINHYYSGKGEEVRFYCWNISYSGSWDATKSLRAKIDEAGGFGREQNMNLKKIIKYFSGNSEDVDNVRSIALSIDAKSIRKTTDRQSEAEEEQPQKPAEEGSSDKNI
jgi:hypothetical protein